MDRASEGDRFADLIGALAETFKSKPTTALVEGYWLALKDLAFDDFARGVEACLRACQFMPAPVEIRDAAGPAGTDRPEQAWACLLAAIRKTAGEDQEFEDGLIGVIVDRLGGWEHVTGLPSEELLKWTRKEFLELYRAGMRCGDPGPVTVFGWLGAGSSKGCADRQRIAAPYLVTRERIGA